MRHDSPNDATEILRLTAMQLQLLALIKEHQCMELNKRTNVYKYAHGKGAGYSASWRILCDAYCLAVNYSGDHPTSWISHYTKAIVRERGSFQKALDHIDTLLAELSGHKPA